MLELFGIVDSFAIVGLLGNPLAEVVCVVSLPPVAGVGLSLGGRSGLQASARLASLDLGSNRFFDVLLDSGFLNG